MFEVDSMSRSNHLMSNHYLVKDLKKIFKNQWNLFSTDRPAPAPIDCLNLKKTIAVSCGVVHSAVLTKVQNFFYTIFLNHFWGIKLYRNAVTEFQLQTSLWPLNTIAGCKTKKKKKTHTLALGKRVSGGRNGAGYGGWSVPELSQVKLLISLTKSPNVFLVP